MQSLTASFSHLTLAFMSALETPETKKTSSQFRLKKFLETSDSDATPKKIATWKEILDKSPKTPHPPSYLHDVSRFTIHVGNRPFAITQNPDEVAIRIKEIDNMMLAMLCELQCALGKTTEGLHLLKYLLQDLLNQALFAIDPDLPADYNHSLIKEGMLLIDMSEDHAQKTPSFSLSLKNDIVYLSGIQYWKVVDNKQPLTILGYDAHRVTLAICLEGVDKKTVLSKFEQALCTVRFHGVRKTLDDISY